MNLLLDSTIKVSLVVLLGLGMWALLQKRSAALRHWLLTITIVCSAAMPLLAVVLPTWHVQMWNLARLGPVAPPRGTVTIDVGDGTNAIVSSKSAIERPAQPARRGRVLGAVWMAGVAMSLGFLLVGFAQLRSITSRSERLVQGKWVELAADISRLYRLPRRVLLLTADHPTLLVTWGIARPRVVLPTGAREWPEDRIRVVLGHELAHVQRRDWLVQMVVEVLRAVYWFNPLLWIVCRCLRHESEQACDDAVLNLGIDAADYASHLVDLARAFNQRRRTWLPAASMARPSSLEGRIRAMLNAHINRRPITRSIRVAIVSVLLSITVAIAGVATFAQTASAALSGFVFDATGAAIPAVGVTLVHAGPAIQTFQTSSKPFNIRFKEAGVKDVLNFFAKPAGISITYDSGVLDRAITIQLDDVMMQQALDNIMAAGQLSYKVLDERSIFVFSESKNVKYEARTDAAGYFEFVGLTPDTYALEIRMLGFENLLDAVTLSEGQALQRNIALQVSAVQETITVRDVANSGIPTVRTGTPPARTQRCTGSPVGGRIVPPAKIRDVRPQYPHVAGDAAVEGRVVLDVRIGTDGFVKDVRARAPVDLNRVSLATAAIAAVSQWQFTPTLLDCVPVEVNMTATVNFTSQH